MDTKHKLNLGERDLNLEESLLDNPVVLFPSVRVQAWDNMPRFVFLDANIRKTLKEKVTVSSRIRAPLKSNFVGSPVRTKRKGGILADPKVNFSSCNSKNKTQESTSAGAGRKKGRTTKAAENIKDSITLYAALNVIGMARLRDKV